MIVLDTNAWLFWLHDPRRLSRAARRAVEEEAEEGEMLVSAISVWEVAVKVELGRLALPFDIDTWLAKALRYPSIAIEPVGPVDAVASTRLPGRFGRDPADRLIVALARRLGAPLVTADKAIRSYRHVRTIW